MEVRLYTIAVKLLKKVTQLTTYHTVEYC